MVEVSLILCYHDAHERLPWTLEKLKHLEAGVKWELIAVDNASNSSTGRMIVQAFAEEVEARVVSIVEPRPGKQHAFLAGASHASGEIWVVLDDDNGLHPDYLTRMVETFKANPDVAMVGGQGRAVTDVPLPSWFDAVQFRWAVGPQGGRTDAGPLLYIWGAGVGIRAAWANQIIQSHYPFIMSGPTTDHRLQGAEDVEWGFLFQALGKVCWYEPGLVFDHKIPSDRLTEAHAAALEAARKESTRRVSAYYRPLISFCRAAPRRKLKLVMDSLRRRGEFPMPQRMLLQLLIGRSICIESRVRKILSLEL